MCHFSAPATEPEVGIAGPGDGTAPPADEAPATPAPAPAAPFPPVPAGPPGEAPPVDELLPPPPPPAGAGEPAVGGVPGMPVSVLHQ